MDKKAIYAIMGIAVLATSTLAFGASLATTTAVDRIGSDSNVAVAAARGNVTALAWTEEVAADGVIEVDTITFTVGNEDTAAAHTFQVCAVIEGPASTFSPAAGSAPECVSTASIGARGAGSDQQTGVTLAFTTAVDVTDIVDISISLEETA